MFLSFSLENLFTNCVVRCFQLFHFVPLVYLKNKVLFYFKTLSDFALITEFPCRELLLASDSLSPEWEVTARQGLKPALNSHGGGVSGVPHEYQVPG